ncbi:MAG: RluA family pseudouridine synthase [Trichloromonas sp.]|nr:RluA family pseudouridine synthase [Trichloromonas sp.]
MIEWQVHPTEADNPLEFLANRLPGAPRSYLRQLLRKGRVRRDGEPLDEDALLRPGDRLILPDSARLRQLLALPPVPVILYETREMLIVEKPAGLAVHGSKGHEEDHLLGRIQALLQERRAPYSVAPVHRLDLETSGPILFAKGRQAAGRLGRLFMDGAARKSYLALVAGELVGAGRLESPVRAKGTLKAAATGYRTRTGFGDFTLVELELLSGRTHQIRQQLAAIGHPLGGDRRYGGPTPPGLKRLFLHCRRLSLPDPFGGPDVLAESPLPAELAQFLSALEARTS